jgi:gamma-glutamyltranspeptidase/glutathione hydrolase
MRTRKGLLDDHDFAEHHSDWVEPISTSYRGYDVFELPFNTQGFVTLEMLNILEGFEIAPLGHNSAAHLHLLVEANRIAFADRAAHLADRGGVPSATMKMLISKEYATVRRKEIRPDRAAASYAAGRQPASREQAAPLSFDITATGDTIYLTAADGQGNVILLIQSLYDAFGAGIVAGDTGIAMQNRGALFTLQAGHPNQIAPGKRLFHTLVPAMVMKDNRPWLSFGVMGGDMQPQGHVQVLLNLIEFGMNIQEAGEAARYRLTSSGVALESAIGAETGAGLVKRGHNVRNGVGMWGGFQGILIDPRTGVLMGGSDPRKDGLAIGY